jgi:6-phosphogluconolactonase (cycloisomerase 2 family)
MRLVNLFALIGLVILLSGCLSDSRADASVGFEIAVVGDSPDNGVLGNRKIEFINNQISYDEAVSRYSSEPTELIDFTQNQVVLLDMGQTGGGHTIRVDSISEMDGKLSIYATETSPGEGCYVSLTFTSPYVFVRVSSTARVESIVVNEEVTNCNAS